MITYRVTLFIAVAPIILRADFLEFSEHPYRDIEVDDVVKIDVRDTGSGPRLDSYSLRVSFDANILEYLGYKYSGDPHTRRVSTDEPQVGNDWVVLGESDADGIHGLLFALTFRALASGTTPLLLTTADPSDFDVGRSISDRDDLLDSSSISVVGTAPNDVAAVPEPSAAALIIAVILGTAVIARKTGAFLRLTQ